MNENMTPTNQEYRDFIADQLRDQLKREPTENEIDNEIDDLNEFARRLHENG